MQKERIITIVQIVSRALLGLVFIFSSFVKGVDPMGSAFKFSDYFVAFHLGFLEPVTIVLSFLLATAEFLIGISLLFGLRFRLGAWGVMIFMIFFTVLTFIVALTNPVSDCGCFGDAVIMTNWQTFIKNLILLPFAILVFLYRKKQAEPVAAAYSWGGLLAFGSLFFALELNACRHLPLLDFRPYSTGTYIPEKMSIPEGAPQDEYQTILTYEKNGKIKEFTEENYPWQDTTWEFVDSRHILLKKGYEPPIHDFTIVDPYGIDHAGNILQDGGYNFLLVSTHLEKADRNGLILADELASWCIAGGHSFYCMTASLEQDILKTREDLDLGFDIYTTDEITLKTIIRSNPGLLLVKEGTILGKWHFRDIPSPDKLQGGMLPYLMTQYRKVHELWSVSIFIALFLVISAFMIYLPYRRKNSR